MMVSGQLPVAGVSFVLVDRVLARSPFVLAGKVVDTALPPAGLAGRARVQRETAPAQMSRDTYYPVPPWVVPRIYMVSPLVVFLGDFL
jgi:hypothetical protein